MLEKIINSNYLQYFVLAIIPLLVLGPFFPDLIVSLSSIFFLIFVFKKKYFYLFNNKIFFFFITFCLICIVSSILSKNIIFSFYSSLFYFRIGIFAFLIKYLLDRNPDLFKKFYYVLLFTFLSLIVDGYIQFFFGKNIFQYSPGYGRISSFFGKELVLGSYLSRLFPLFFALLILKCNLKYEFILGLVILILGDVLIFISGERTSFFFLNLSTLFIILFIKKFKKIRIISFLLSAIIIFIIVNFSTDIKNRMINTTLEQLNFIQNDNTPSKDFLGNYRSLYQIAWKMFLDKPILGHGPKMFRIKCKLNEYNPDYDEINNRNCTTHPHNFYFQILAEVGLLGFFFLLVVNYFFLKLLFIHIKSLFFKKKSYLTDYQICLLASVLITIWPLSPNGNFFNNWLMIVYSLSFGFLLHSFRRYI
jgi:O-antigen ligase